MTQLLINNGLYDVDKSPLVGSGGEGIIYRVADDVAAKVYFPKVMDDQLRQKVLALCNSFANHVADFSSSAFAFPQHPAYDQQEAFNLLVGFSMPFFPDCPGLHQVGYDLNERKYSTPGLSDAKAIALIYKAFELAQRLHRARIILGDISPDNILFNRRLESPIFIDLGAVQIGSFECRVHKLEYLDPLIELAGKRLNGAYHYSIESDIFALACVAYELFVGVHPYFFYTNPPAVEEENKRLGFSILRRWVQGDSHLRSSGRQYLPEAANEAIQARLEELKKQDIRLFEFFVSVFVHNERETLLAKLPLTDPRNPAHSIVFDRIITPFRGLGFESTIEELVRERDKAAAQQQAPQPTFPATAAGRSTTLVLAKAEPLPDKAMYEDPGELGVFLGSYDIAYSALVRGL